MDYSKQINLKISDEQHRQLKTLASYSGLSMKEFILSRVFVESAETVFESRHSQKEPDEKIDNLQKDYFDKSQVIVLSPEKWAELKDKLKA